MNIEDFKIGDVFYASAGFPWKCTDIGTRTITAICLLDPKKEDYSEYDAFFISPEETHEKSNDIVYKVEEKVFDFYDMKSCFKDFSKEITRRTESSHGGIPIEDAKIMIFSKFHKTENHYPNKKIIDRNRIHKNNILHPYAAKKEEDKWNILVFNITTQTHDSIPEEVFITYPLLYP